MDKKDKKKTQNDNYLKIVVAGILIILGFVIFNSSNDNNVKEDSGKTETAIEKKPAVEEKDESQLKADVKRAIDVPGIEVTNLESVPWNNCQITLNDDFRREIRNPLGPNEPLNNPYALFTKDDGTKFNPETTAAKTVLIRCEVNDITRYGVYKF